MADPGELTSGDRIDMARKAAQNLRLLLEAIQRGELVATQLEMARLRGAMEALREVAGEPPPS
jgi:hypothetical protein